MGEGGVKIMPTLFLKQIHKLRILNWQFDIVFHEKIKKLLIP